MKTNLLIIFLILCGVNIAQAQDNQYSLRASIDVRFMFCDFKVNDVSSFDNRRRTFADKGIVSTNTNVQVLSKKGENSIELEVAPLSWFESVQSEKPNDLFDKDAYCRINIYQTDNTTGEERVLLSMNILIDNDGFPQSYVKNNIDEEVRKDIIFAKNTDKVSFNKIRNVIGDFEYPKNIKLTKFTKKISLSDVPDWIWVNATDYDAKNLNKLKDAYQELWDAFNNKSVSAIREINLPANETWAVSTNSTEKSIFESYNITERVKNSSSKMIPIDWNNFIPVIMNNGKMVKMVYKEDFSYSPITMIYLNSKGEKLLYSFSPIFAFVNGKFIPVI
ncbi:hypothetical protein [Providencia manganoxydans]|uniref:hypothetical protein n=1 Tax=Providencia manganoxydans TaxID=2923283 RepID=UPI002853F0D6|nr:hypothetical protein [Providencia stuartii]